MMHIFDETFKRRKIWLYTIEENPIFKWYLNNRGEEGTSYCPSSPISPQTLLKSSLKYFNLIFWFISWLISSNLRLPPPRLLSLQREHTNRGPPLLWLSLEAT